jgi:hypothetical protein
VCWGRSGRGPGVAGARSVCAWRQTDSLTIAGTVPSVSTTSEAGAGDIRVTLPAAGSRVTVRRDGVTPYGASSRGELKSGSVSAGMGSPGSRNPSSAS